MVYWADLLYKRSLHDYANFDFNQLYDDAPNIADIAEFLVGTSMACLIHSLPARCRQSAGPSPSLT